MFVSLATLFGDRSSHLALPTGLAVVLFSLHRARVGSLWNHRSHRQACERSCHGGMGLRFDLARTSCLCGA